MSGLSALALGFWRTGIVGILLLFRAQRPNAKYWFFTICSGFFLALHFWTWFTSLNHTSAFRSTLLVCLNPFWVALWEWKNGNPPSKSFWIGGFLAFTSAGPLRTVAQSYDASGGPAEITLFLCTASGGHFLQRKCGFA